VTVALVTGASSGIGRAIAWRLAERGHDLVVTARRGDRLEALATEIGARWGRDVETIPADLRDRGDLRRVAERAAQDVDILVANAGFSTRGPFPELRPDLEVAQVELNVISTVVLCQAAAASMCARERGRILVTSSAASFQPLPGLATYGATKAFLTSFAQALDAELRPRGVTVTCLAPGFTATEETVGSPRPAWLWSTSDAVARAAVDGLLAGRSLVVPGLPWRAVGVIAPRLPRSLVRQLARRLGSRMAERADAPER
jgi:short-subunit dehydrogenase